MRLRLCSALLAVAMTACGGGEAQSLDESEPSATIGILQAGEVAATACEQAILASHEHSGIDDEYSRLEAVVFATCTFAEFSAFNSKVTPNYRYPGDGSGFVDRACRIQEEYIGSLLCQP